MHPLQNRFRSSSPLLLAAALATFFFGALAGCRNPARREALETKSPIGPYSAAVAAGELVFLAGKIGDSTLPFREEVATAIDVVEADLERLGLTLADVVSVNVFLTDMASFGDLNEVYGARFSKPYPARTTVGVAALPKGAHVELQAVAIRR